MKEYIFLADNKQTNWWTLAVLVVSAMWIIAYAYFAPLMIELETSLDNINAIRYENLLANTKIKISLEK